MWLLLYGTRLSGGGGGRTAVIIQPASPNEVAPLVALAYGLSSRECQVTRLSLQGQSTKQMAAAPGVSPYTVQDHLKSIFDKTGVRTRGELMQTADPAGAMAAVIGLDAYVVARALIGTHVVVANDNAPGQVVISGPRSELAGATTELKNIGAKRVIALRVSAAFHSPAMQGAAPRLREAIDVTPFSALRYRLSANVDARVHEHAREMPSLLEKQVWSPVQWVASVKRAHGEGASAFVEFGPGTVLTGLIKRILPGMITGNVSDESTLRQSLPLLKGDAR